MEPVRAFIAMELPGEVKRALAGLQSRLKSAGRTPVKWVGTENLHLTLKFLGDTAAGQVPDIIRAVSASVPGTRPFSVRLGGLGVFPNTRRPQVVWVGLEGDTAGIIRLQQRIEAALQPLGFPAESRPFRPHLTIGRVRDHASPGDRQELGRAIENPGGTPAAGFTVAAVVLVKSRLTREGPVYTTLGSVPLR